MGTGVVAVSFSVVFSRKERSDERDRERKSPDAFAPGRLYIGRNSALLSASAGLHGTAQACASGSAASDFCPLVGKVGKSAARRDAIHPLVVRLDRRRERVEDRWTGQCRSRLTRRDQRRRNVLTPGSRRGKEDGDCFVSVPDRSRWSAVLCSREHTVCPCSKHNDELKWSGMAISRGGTRP